jgi:hypothetical protein
MRKITAYKINVKDCEISVVQLEETPEMKMHRVMANEIGCTTITMFNSGDDQNDFVCDDEGLFGEIEGGFMGEHFAYPVPGNALFLGVDVNTGMFTEAPTIALEEFAKKIHFVSKEKMEKYAERFN